MRIASVAGRLAIVSSEGDGIDVAAASGGEFGADPQAVYERWPNFRTWADRLDLADVTAASRVAVTDEVLCLPTPAPRQVFGIGANYATHVGETGRPTPADLVVFTKFPSCLVGPFAEIALPSKHVDWEIELVAVIGSRAEHISEDDAWSHVAGLTVGQDISERTLQHTGARGQYSMAKSMPTFGPIGPYVVTPDEFENPNDLTLRSTLNGEQIQHGRTADMIFSVPQIIARLSALCVLLPGDLIFTGTPSGVGSQRKPPRYLEVGEVLVSTIDGIGEMRNTCNRAAVELEYR